MRIFIYGVLYILAAGCMLCMVLLGIDMEVARRDYVQGHKTEGCIFNFVCERYNNGKL